MQEELLEKRLFLIKLMHLIRVRHPLLFSYLHQHQLHVNPVIVEILDASSYTVNASLKVFIVHQIAAIVRTARTTFYLRISAKMPFSKRLKRPLMHLDQKSIPRLTRKFLLLIAWRRRRSLQPSRRTRFKPMRLPRPRSSTQGAAPVRSLPASKSTANAFRLAYYAPVCASAIIAKTMRIQLNVKQSSKTNCSG